jgi:hypothetical protein
MAKQLAPIRVISFCLLAACEALCQSERPLVDSLQRLQFDSPNSPEVQRQETRAWSSLPDAPSSVQRPTKQNARLFMKQAGFNTRGRSHCGHTARNKSGPRHCRTPAQFYVLLSTSVCSERTQPLS